MVAHAFNPSSLEVEAGGSLELKASLVYTHTQKERERDRHAHRQTDRQTVLVSSRTARATQRGEKKTEWRNGVLSCMSVVPSELLAQLHGM